jgi:hypothetical protein
MANPTLPIIRCREMTDADSGDAIDLLKKGFRSRDRRFWLTCLERLAQHPTPAGSPKYGYILDCDGTAVGIVLTISSRKCANNSDMTQCNLSSWYVEPAYRFYAGLFAAHVWKDRTSTYLNINPAPHTRPIIEAQGFSRYSDGQFVAVPALSPTSGKISAKVVRVDTSSVTSFESFERDLLLAHENYGCMSLNCTGPNFAFPFVFRRRIVKGFVPCAQLIYCRDIGDFVRFARPLGRFLASQGLFLVLVDSNGKIPGLVGRYFSNLMPKYFKGPLAPRLGNLAFTETAMFGV